MKKDAVVGEAEAKRDSTIAEAKANEQKMQVQTFFFNIKYQIRQNFQNLSITKDAGKQILFFFNIKFDIDFRQNFQMTRRSLAPRGTLS